MNGYTVDYNPLASDELADIYLVTADRAGVTRASDRIDRLLAADPLGHGTHISEGLYRLVVPPLAVLFTVDPASRTVEVVGVGTVN